MRKLIALLLSLGMLLAIPMAASAASTDPSPDYPYDTGASADTTEVEYAYDTSPKTADSTKAGLAIGVIVVAGGVAYFSGRKSFKLKKI